MEKLLYIMLIWVVSTTSIYSQTVAGKIGVSGFSWLVIFLLSV